MPKKKRKGFFVCIEGLDGSGKTTQARRLVRTLKAKGYDAVYTTEPSKRLFGKIIRKHILQRKNRVPPVVEAFLFAADRVDHVENEIKPLLEGGKIVVCDRYVYSSISYQGAARLDLTWIKEINRFAIEPDLAIYIDVPPQLVIERLKREKTAMETLHTQREVKKGYLKLVREKQLMAVEGDAPMDEVALNIEKSVLDSLDGATPSESH